MRRLRAFLVGALVGPLALALRLSARRAGVALVYHGLREDGSDPADVLVRRHGSAVFAAQLRYLHSRYRLVPADRLQHEAAARRRGQRFPVALTFDDDLASHARLAAPIMEKVGAPATFFLCGSSLEKPHTFWWQRLQRAVDAGIEVPLEAEDIFEMARQLEALSVAKRTEIDEDLARRLGPDEHEQGLRGGDVRALAEKRFDIGFHTLNHVTLVGLDDPALAHSLTDGRADLEQAAGRRLTAIAYPHGKADERVAIAARQAGFGVGFTGSSEPVRPSSDALLLGRVEPAHAPVARLALQLVRVLFQRDHR
jgi:peptidoglycan/xylan/chitin deacetylase (PgdA/CDA1 family)